MTFLMGITSVNGLSIAEQRMQELEVMANRAIAHITPAMTCSQSGEILSIGNKAR